MAVVKIPNKDELDILVANLTLRIGKKISQQEILDLYIHFASIHLDEIEKFLLPQKNLSPSEIKEILDSADDFDFDALKSIDEVIYKY
ncbi:MAG: hypothetical protein ACTSVU_03580 [Promethearchaeota archaeon]